MLHTLSLLQEGQWGMYRREGVCKCCGCLLRILLPKHTLCDFTVVVLCVCLSVPALAASGHVYTSIGSGFS